MFITGNKCGVWRGSVRAHIECSQGVVSWTRNRIKIMRFVAAVLWQEFVLTFSGKVAQNQIHSYEIKKKISKSTIFRKVRYVHKVAVTVTYSRWPCYHKGTRKGWKCWATELGIVTKKLPDPVERDLEVTNDITTLRVSATELVLRVVKQDRTSYHYKKFATRSLAAVTLPSILPTTVEVCFEKWRLKFVGWFLRPFSATCKP